MIFINEYLQYIVIYLLVRLGVWRGGLAGMAALTATTSRETTMVDCHIEPTAIRWMSLYDQYHGPG